MSDKILNTTEILELSQALAVAVESFEFGRPYAKAIFTEHLRASGYDVNKKVNKPVEETGK